MGKLQAKFLVISVLVMAGTSVGSYVNAGSISIASEQYDYVSGYAWGYGVQSETRQGVNTSVSGFDNGSNIASGSARASVGALGGSSVVNSIATDFNRSGTVEAKGEASFEQLFRVTQAGEATLSWAIDGELGFAESVYGNSEHFFKAEYTFTSYLREVNENTTSRFDPNSYASTSRTVSSSETVTNNGGLQPAARISTVDESGVLNFNFDDSLLGKYFILGGSLKTLVTAGDSSALVDSINPEQPLVWANFMNTGTTAMTGGIAAAPADITPVPLPASAWMLLSGVFAFGFLRRFSMKSV